MSLPPRPEPLAEELSSVLAHFDRVPSALLDAASATLRWRDPDARLAALVDADAPSTPALAVRGAPTRMLSFKLDAGKIDAGRPDAGRPDTVGVDAVSIDVTVSAEDDRVRLIGQIAPTGVMAVEVRHPHGVWTGHTDDLGRFAVTDLPAGPMRIFCAPDAAHEPIGTEIFTA